MILSGTNATSLDVAKTLAEGSLRNLGIPEEEKKPDNELYRQIFTKLLATTPQKLSADEEFKLENLGDVAEQNLKAYWQKKFEEENAVNLSPITGPAVTATTGLPEKEDKEEAEDKSDKKSKTNEKTGLKTTDAASQEYADPKDRLYEATSFGQALGIAFTSMHPGLTIPRFLVVAAFSVASSAVKMGLYAPLAPVALALGAIPRLITGRANFLTNSADQLWKNAFSPTPWGRIKNWAKNSRGPDGKINDFMAAVVNAMSKYSGPAALSGGGVGFGLLRYLMKAVRAVGSLIAGVVSVPVGLAIGAVGLGALATGNRDLAGKCLTGVKNCSLDLIKGAYNGTLGVLPMMPVVGLASEAMLVNAYNNRNTPAAAPGPSAATISSSVVQGPKNASNNNTATVASSSPNYIRPALGKQAENLNAKATAVLQVAPTNNSLPPRIPATANLRVAPWTTVANNTKPTGSGYFASMATPIVTAVPEGQSPPISRADGNSSISV